MPRNIPELLGSSTELRPDSDQQYFVDPSANPPSLLPDSSTASVTIPKARKVMPGVAQEYSPVISGQTYDEETTALDWDEATDRVLRSALRTGQYNELITDPAKLDKAIQEELEKQQTRDKAEKAETGASEQPYDHEVPAITPAIGNFAVTDRIAS